MHGELWNMTGHGIVPIWRQAGWTFVFLLGLMICYRLLVGVIDGGHNLLGEMAPVTQSCPTLWDPTDCSLPGSFVHGIFQARVLEWVAISFSRISSRPRDRTQVSCIVGRFFTSWATREACEGTWRMGPISRESTCIAGEPGLIPGSGRSLGEGNGNTLQYSCLENPMDRGA